MEQDIRELAVPALLGEVDRVRSFLHEYVADLGLDEEDGLKIELALHEICVNIALYAYPEDSAGDLAIRIWRDDRTLFMEIRDRGVPFDPVKKPDPDLIARFRVGTRGGLGVYFFRKMMDGLSYRRVGDENILTVSKKI
jgi:serine/threonine-protein kinase RsbW